MSGPKVVKIVTREELIAACEGQIATLEAMVEQWRLFGERNRIVHDREVELARRRVTAMQTLLARDRFEDVQKRIPAEISFLKADMERRMQAAADAAAAERKHERQLMRSAEAVARALRERNLAVPAELASPLRHSKEALQKAMSAAFAALVPATADRSVSDRQRELAASLGSGEARLTFSSWLESQAGHFQDDHVLVSLERKVDELRAFDPQAVTGFAARLDAVSAEKGARRGLLADSLMIDLAAARREAVRRVEFGAELQGVRAEFATIGGEAGAAQIRAIERALAAKNDTDGLQAALDEGKSALETLRNVQALALRRQALLEGLAELGYEVKEGMKAAWVEHGRVVLRSSRSPSYGVELGGSPENLIQVRTVAFEDAHSPRDRTRDIQAETEFCGDFEALRKLVAAGGGAISVVKALGVGSTAVKTVPAAYSEPQSAFTGNPQSSRLTRS
jgi:hypothetical protein